MTWTKPNRYWSTSLREKKKCQDQKLRKQQKWKSCLLYTSHICVSAANVRCTKQFPGTAVFKDSDSSYAVVFIQIFLSCCNIKVPVRCSIESSPQWKRKLYCCYICLLYTSWTLKEGTDYTVTYAIKKDASGKAENKLGNTVVSTIKYSKDAQNNYGVGETDTVESTIVGKTLTSANIKTVSYTHLYSRCSRGTVYRWCLDCKIRQRTSNLCCMGKFR